jgi:hypothetical protein
VSHHRCNGGRTLITYCVCGRDATIDESSVIDAAVAAERERCLAWAKHAGRGYWNDIHGATKGIASGAPAPKE